MYRRFVVAFAGLRIIGIRAIYMSIVFIRAVFKGYRFQEANAVSVAMHNAIYTYKPGEPNMMQHDVPLRGNSSWPRHGPWGAQGRLPITNWLTGGVGLSWTSHSPIPVQPRVICCILALRKQQ